MSGEIVGNRYELLNLIGSGGVSTVYRARDTSRDREIALKILHPHLASKTSVVKQLEREVEITGKIDHPGVARYFEMQSDENHTYLVLEYLPGGDLKRRIGATGAVPVGEAIRLSLEVLDALGAAHELGIIHRDIKPHNILLDEADHIRLTDFGLAKTSAALSVYDAARAGTPDYVAPEVSSGGYADARSDLYSFGITLYEMLTGVLPYRANNPHKVLWNHGNAPIPSVKQVQPTMPEYLDQILVKAMAKEPSDRFQTALSFADALRSAMAPNPAPALASHACPFCGVEILEAFPFCLQCDKPEVFIATPARGEPAFAVSIIGPGKPGERFDPVLRHDVLTLLESVGATTRTLGKKIPRLPFILLKGLSMSSAEYLARSLERLGVQSLVTGKSQPEARRRLRRFINKKTLTLYPRVLMIGFTTMVPTWGSIGQSAPDVMAVIVITILAGALATMRLTFEKAIVKKGNFRSSPKTASLVDCAEDIHAPEVKKLIRNIAGRLHLLLSVDPSGQPYAHELTDLTSIIDPILEELRTYMQTIALLEENLRNVAYKDSEAARVRRDIEATLQLYIDRMLRFSVAIDLLCVNYAGVQQGRVEALARELSVAGSDLAIQSDAAREVISAIGFVDEGARE